MMMMTTQLPVSLQGRTWGDEARVRVENIKTLGVNFFKSATQDTNTFKIGSALIASFALVAARVYIATRSANKEADATGADSDSTLFCKDQALMTTVREIGGFITSWLFMALFNVAMDKPSQLLFGVRTNKHGVTGPITFLSKLGQQVVPFGNRVLEEGLPKAVGSKQTLHVLGNATTFSSHNPSPMENYLSTLKPNKVQLFFRRGLELLVNQPQLKQELAIDAFYHNLPVSLSVEEKATALLKAEGTVIERKSGKLDPTVYNAALIQRGFTNFSTYVVPVVGAVISTVVAGWMLERATLLHFPEIIDKINQLRVKRNRRTTDEPMVETPVPLTAASPQTAVSPSFVQQSMADDLPVFNRTLSQLQFNTQPTVFPARRSFPSQSSSLW